MTQRAAVPGVAEADARMLRWAILWHDGVYERLLAAEPLYPNEDFAEPLEAAARRNMADELERLRSPVRPE